MDGATKGHNKEGNMKIGVAFKGNGLLTTVQKIDRQDV
jgi:hypothetical protein